MMEQTPTTDVFRELLDGLDLPRVPQQARSRQKRDALLKAAGHLFAERGYEATTADDIAAAAEVSIGTFYSYFRNKRQVLLTLYATCVESIDAIRIDRANFAQDQRVAIRNMISQTLQRDPLFYGLQRAWHELLPRDEEVARYDSLLNQGICRQILTAMRNAAAAGLTWPDLDLERTSWIVTLLLDHNWHTMPHPDSQTAEDRERHLDALTALIHRAIFKQ